ncbi:hypothetical protein [Planctomyces sp. SH-PL62]|uniref:hypothetical protein n=1 Tax=Planctomyces sp. SH-PL62 TaxID=1636152 RepID=UPI00078EB63C|nr:hypothetical protein [Planctomyces sp. SH-PL62]AMV40500.1 hypothetical protein VT85_23925 [Planctomyces sp. SH-PL62]
MSTTPRFVLGRVVATAEVLEALRRADQDLGELLRRHAAGDWGEVDAHDRRENELSVRNGFRVLSAYTLRTGVKVWLITEADRSSTCCLLPSEY